MNSNVLNPQSASASPNVLGGNVSTVVKYIGMENLHASMHAAQLEQEAICGYPLIITKTRTTKTKDVNNNDVYEVYATFSPVPQVTPEMIAADARLQVQHSPTPAAPEATDGTKA